MAATTLVTAAAVIYAVNAGATAALAVLTALVVLLPATDLVIVWIQRLVAAFHAGILSLIPLPSGRHQDGDHRLVPAFTPGAFQSSSSITR
ncbi:MAG TPA: hypothetical protein VNJ03_16495 [Vicinamibacterales bacterium]|nr:hypothetical protein [Vicinamibacterales bacterium]